MELEEIRRLSAGAEVFSFDWLPFAGDPPQDKAEKIIDVLMQVTLNMIENGAVGYFKVTASTEVFTVLQILLGSHHETGNNDQFWLGKPREIGVLRKRWRLWHNSFGVYNEMLVVCGEMTTLGQLQNFNGL